MSAESTPYGRERDDAVARQLTDDGIDWVATGSPYAVSPGRVTKDDGSPYRVFTPYAKAWRRHGWRPPASTPRSVDWQTYDGPHLADLPTAPAVDGLPTPTEAAARRAWHRFRDEHLDGYARARDDPGADYVRRWVPELRGLPGKAAHTPWDHDGHDYVARMVDHAEERAEALRRYEAVRLSE